MHALKIVEISDGLGVVLPSDVAFKYGLISGQTLIAVETADGCVLTAAPSAGDGPPSTRTAP